MKAPIVFLLFALMVGLNAMPTGTAGDRKGACTCENVLLEYLSSTYQTLCGFVTDTCSNLIVIPGDLALKMLEPDFFNFPVTKGSPISARKKRQT